jgi:Holliday junction resolvase RusA-like endonuclease
VISFTVPGLPYAQPRQRHRIAGAGGKRFVQNYTPKDDPVNEFKASVRLAFAQAYSGQPLAGPIAISALFVFPRPGRLIWKKRPMPRQYHDVKPDADNLLKSLKDALKSLAWADDSQVAVLRGIKVYAAGGEQTRTEVQIKEIV